ncbi:MAG TPA: PAAR domain-containing protein [Thermoanaerobaculia bacterium]|nr:PAAR domain-containing protein [Thermoanaerobaculia bacterium]
MNPAARLGDNHTCPMLNPDESPHTGGWITEGDDSVQIGYMSAARCGDQATCIGPTDVIDTGNASVLIGYMPAAALGDRTTHGGVITEGETTVLIGDSTAGAGGSTGATMRAARNEARPLCELCSEGQGES